MRGRLVRSAFGATPPDRGRRMDRLEVNARLEAGRILARARDEATRIVAAAADELRRRSDEAARDAEQAVEAKAAALFLALRRREEEMDVGARDRMLETARILAERLLGASLELDPGRIAKLAGEALREARGARRATIEAHPDDVAALEAALATARLGPTSVEVRPNSSLARGDLCLHTDLGTLDAKLAPRLERLAAALRDALE
jgi:flagellar biosynthesis/type III secretory pathway protein FliH